MVMLYAPPVYSINFFFSHLGVEDGLSQVSVLDIFQDSDGYIWFGTRNGANRYVITARMIPINQNRTTIFDSGTTLKGFCIKACIPALPGFWKW